MNAKKYLEKIREAEIKLGQRIDELNDMRSRITLISGIDYSKDRVQSSPSSGNKQIEALVDLEAKIWSAVQTEEELKDKIIGEIQQLTNPLYVDILFRRYVKFQSFERISYDMNYAYNYVCNLHGEALIAFENEVLNLS